MLQSVKHDGDNMQSRTAGLTFQRAGSPEVDIVSCRKWLPVLCEKSTKAQNPHQYGMVFNCLQVNFGSLVLLRRTTVSRSLVRK
jgi:hypothetical protein